MSDRQKWQLLALTALLGGLLYLLAPVLTPFAVSALLAYLGDSWVDELERYRIPRTLAVTLVFALMSLAMIGVVLLLIPLLEGQIYRLIESAPRYAAWLTGTVRPWIEAKTGIALPPLDFDSVANMLAENWKQAGGIAATVLGGLSKSGIAVLGWIVNLLLIPMLTFYLLRDWDLLITRIRDLLPRSVEPVVSQLTRQSDQMLGGFLRGQLSVMFALGAIYSIGLALAGVDVALLIGMLAGLISFVPYLGTFIGLLAAVIATLVQHGDVLHLLLVLLVFGVGQILEGFVLTPWLVGGRIRLHPVAVIFAVMAGGQLFGFLGVLLALPAASVVMVLLRYAYQRYTASPLYSAEAGAISEADTGKIMAAAAVGGDKPGTAAGHANAVKQDGEQDNAGQDITERTGP